MGYCLKICYNFNCDCEAEVHSLNSKIRCIVCLEDFTDEQRHPKTNVFEGLKVDGPNKQIDEQNQRERTVTETNPIIKHHVKYFPQIVAYVHYRCHQKIHDPDNPITSLIQYTREESLQFYKDKDND